MKKKLNAVARLSCAALALPGLMQTAQAGRVDETYDVDVQYGRYQESDNRIGVNIFESSLSIPIGKTMTGTLNVVRDTISGASPIYNEKDSKGKVTQVISGASQKAASSSCGKSICEERNAINTGLTYFFDNAALNVGSGYSKENDYLSKYLSTNLSVELNKKMTTLNFGGSVASDEIEPTNFNIDCGDKCNKHTQQYLLGVTQIVDKNSLVQSNLTYAHSKGYLSDPYKRVLFYDVDNNLSGIGADKRPRDKNQWAWLTRYVRHFEGMHNAALHVDYRFTSDDWGTKSHTAELSWHQPLGNGWQVIPRLRYYTQNQADFYGATFTGKTADYAYYSSDYRLAGFGTVSGGLKFSKDMGRVNALKHLQFQAGLEYFDHKAAYQLGGSGSGNNGSFTDFRYYLLTASFNLKF